MAGACRRRLARFLFGRMRRPPGIFSRSCWSSSPWVIFFNQETLVMPLLRAGPGRRAHRRNGSTPLSPSGCSAWMARPPLHGLVHFLSAMLMIHVLYADEALFFLFVLDDAGRPRRNPRACGPP